MTECVQSSGESSELAVGSFLGDESIGCGSSHRSFRQAKLRLRGFGVSVFQGLQESLDLGSHATSSMLVSLPTSLGLADTLEG